MTAFEHLSAGVAEKLAERGIDPDASFDALLIEIRVQPPSRLLTNLHRAPVLSERQIRSECWLGYDVLSR